MRRKKREEGRGENRKDKEKGGDEGEIRREEKQRKE